jgi:hypothetical protein
MVPTAAAAALAAKYLTLVRQQKNLDGVAGALVTSVHH